MKKKDKFESTLMPLSEVQRESNCCVKLRDIISGESSLNCEVLPRKKVLLEFVARKFARSVDFLS